MPTKKKAAPPCRPPKAAPPANVPPPKPPEKEETQPEEYVPLTPIEKVRQRLSEGKPVKELLRYMHGQSKVGQPIRDLVNLAGALDQGMTALRHAALNDKGLLRVAPGSDVPAASDIVVQVGKLNKLVDDFMSQAREKVEKLAGE